MLHFFILENAVMYKLKHIWTNSKKTNDWNMFILLNSNKLLWTYLIITQI